MSKITGRDKRVADWLEKIGIDPKMTRRVVIDIPCDGAVWVYIERFGDSQMFEIEPPPELAKGIKIVTPQADFEEAIRIIKGLKTGEQPIISSDYGPDWREEPTPEWLAEFETRQQAAIQKWEHPGG